MCFPEKTEPSAKEVARAVRALEDRRQGRWLDAGGDQIGPGQHREHPRGSPSGGGVDGKHARVRVGERTMTA